MARSSKKGPFVANHLIREIENLNVQRLKKLIKTWSCASAIRAFVN
jgi:small subunit ribosomal protein S19